jgi:NAD+ kinase
VNYDLSLKEKRRFLMIEDKRASRNLYFFYKQGTISETDLEKLVTLAKTNHFTIVPTPDQADAIVSIGGDGTFLQAVRQTGFRSDCLYVGISTGQLGFYCDFDLGDTEEMVYAAKNDDVEVRHYPIIKATFDNTISFYCLNECSIRSAIIKTLAMEVYIDDLHFETFRGDGLIIATPTGSTAYNKSVNGAVVDPKLPCLQVSELASINNNEYRTLGSSFILSEGRSLSIKVIQDGNDYPIIGIDNEALSIQNVKTIDIELSQKRIKTIKLKDNSFWHKVKRSYL